MDYMQKYFTWENFKLINHGITSCMAIYPGMERWRGKVALVTGASAGIGYTTAKQLTELGMNVVGCARNIGTIEVST